MTGARPVVRSGGRRRRSFALRGGLVSLCAGLGACVVAALIAAIVPNAASAAAPHARNDYADAAFSAELGAGLRAFYTRDFTRAQAAFTGALERIPDNTLAIAFLNATALQTPGALDALIDAEEDALGKHPRDYLDHVRLGFSYMFATQAGRDRDADAREELNTAVAIDPDASAAHVGLGILRETDRSMNRAKVEFLAALRGDETNVLAREYLSLIYQTDLRDPQRGLAYVIDIPNVVPDYADIYYHIASLLDDIGQADAACKYATLGLEKDVAHVGEAGRHGYTLLALIYVNEKKTADAKRVLHAAIAAGVDATYAQTLLRKIERGDSDSRETPARTP